MMFSTLAAQGGCPCCLVFGLSAQPGVSKRSAFFASGVDTQSVGRSAARAHLDLPATGLLRLEGGSIVDPRDGRLIENMNVLVSNGVIVALEPADDPNPEPDAQRIDASGKFIVPGYNDMHNHALNEPDPSGALALMLAQGVTGFRQMSGTPDLLAARKAGTLPIGKEAPALLQTAGEVLFPFNAATKEEVIAQVQAQKAQGADFIKMGLTSTEGFWAAMEEAKRVGLPVLGHLQPGASAGDASKAGFKSVEHLGPGIAIWLDCSTEEDQLREETARRPAMKAPPKIPLLMKFIMWKFQSLLINPAAFTSPEDVARMQRAFDTFSDEKCQALAAGYVADGTWQVPTLVRIRHQQLADAPDYETNPELQYMPEKKIKLWRKVTKKFKALPQAMRQTYRDAYPLQLGLTKTFADAGVRMMTGSDGGMLMAPGLTLQEEFVELSKAGLSPLKILQMTTVNAAEYLERTDTMGTVEPGKNADLVLLDANPLDKVENLAGIAGVVRAGVYYSKQDLDGLKQRVAASRGFLH